MPEHIRARFYIGEPSKLLDEARILIKSSLHYDMVPHSFGSLNRMVGLDEDLGIMESN
jgi:hypothetical protein